MHMKYIYTFTFSNGLWQNLINVTDIYIIHLMLSFTI